MRNVARASILFVSLSGDTELSFLFHIPMCPFTLEFIPSRKTLILNCIEVVIALNTEHVTEGALSRILTEATPIFSMEEGLSLKDIERVLTLGAKAPSTPDL